jgi:hypothetical protein
MSQNRGDEKHAWRTAADVVVPSLEEVRQMLSPWLNGRRVRDVQLLTGGLMNRNGRVPIDDAPGSVVLRLYDRDGTACAKEVAVLGLLRRTLVSFRVKVPPDAELGDMTGTVTVSIDGMPVGTINIC